MQPKLNYRYISAELIEANMNNKLHNNMAFVDKLEKYKTSNYKLSNESCNYDKFTAKEVNLRQDFMAKVAKSIWKSAFIS